MGIVCLENHAQDLREVLAEECGLAAVVNLPNASRLVYDCLVLQEHRGEKGAGIVSIKDGKLHHRRRIGTVRTQFAEFNIEKKLPGKTAIGHNRYATAGDFDSVTNVQPLIFEKTRFGPLIIAHNGTLVNHSEITKELTRSGAIFQSSTDSEIIAHLIAQSDENEIEKAIVSALHKIKAAYSLLIMTTDRLFAIRDKFGVRPLSVARLKDGYLIASENYTFDQYAEASDYFDINPGEMIVFKKGSGSFQKMRYAEPEEHFCIFEGIYFSNPRSSYCGFLHEDFRQELGKEIVRENTNLQGDFILPVLDSGKHAAIGMFKESGIDYKEYFLRIHNSPNANLRSFTSPTHEERMTTAYRKLHLRKDKINGRDAIVVDDSIVRSTTIGIITERLRKAGAKSITICISAPPIRNVCPNGMDFQDKKQLVAYRSSIEEIRKQIGADRLIYLSLEGLKKTVSKTYKCGICTGCFGDKYPIN